MKILITGATGFIGSNLISSLIKDTGCFIYTVSKTPVSNSSSNLKNILYNLTDKNFTDKLPENVDVVIHLAQSNEYRNFPDKANDIFEVNVHSTQLLLEWSRKTGVKKFIFASTGNVYKLQNKLLNETDICEPEGYYGASKYAAEQLIKPYNQFFETIILRIFGVYGPGQKKMTIPNMIEKIKNGEEIILADGKGLCFTPLYIDDCVEMITRIIHKNQNSKIINLAGSEKIDLGQLVEIICKIIDTAPKIKLIKKDAMYLMGDTTLFKNEYKYSHSIDIGTGIKKTIKYE